jgi:hypothetical protein
MTTNDTTKTEADGSVERSVGPLCSSCRFPLDEYTAGQRHYGTRKAHAAWYCLHRLCNEVDRLTDALKKANEQTERFERGWDLRTAPEGKAIEHARNSEQAVGRTDSGLNSGDLIADMLRDGAGS